VTGWALLTTLHTRLVEAYSQVLMDSVIGFFEADGHLVTRVVSAPRALRLGRATKASSKHLGKDVGHSASKRVSLGRPVWVSELVKVLALLGVGQDVVGALDLLELLWIATLVGMVLHSKFAIGLLHVPLRTALLEP
jgi:hypothetical protein